MPSSRVSESSSTASSTSVTVSRSSQPILVAGQRQQGSFVGSSTTIHTPESSHIPAADQQFSGLRLLAEISTSQIDPFEELATHQSVTFDDDDQGQSASSLSHSSEPLQSQKPSQPIDDVDHIMILTLLPNNSNGGVKTRTTIGIPNCKVMPSINDHFRRTLSGIVPEAMLSGVAGDPKLPSDQYLAVQSPDPADKRIIWSGDKTMPFKCAYEGCDKKFRRKTALKSHFSIHASDSQLRCHLDNCTGVIRYPSKQALIWHVRANHTFERPHLCNICGHRFRQHQHLKYHKEHVHAPGREKKPPKLRKK